MITTMFDRIWNIMVAVGWVKKEIAKWKNYLELGEQER